MNKFQLSGILLVCIASFSLPVNSATISTTGSFSEVNLLTDYSDDGGPDNSYDRAGSSVVGLQQFDPTLGTLTGVTLTTDFAVTITGMVEAGYSIDPLLDHSASFTITDGFSSGADAVVSYNDTSTSTLSLAFAGANINPACMGNENNDGGPCVGFDQHPFTFGDEMTIVGNTLDKIGLSNILGTGELTGLSVDAFHPFGSDFMTDNTEFGSNFGTVETVISTGTVTLAYEYSVVPVPAAAWLFGSGLISLIGIARRKV